MDGEKERIMKLNTTRFGDIEIDENKIIKFPYGILGFPEVKSYIVLDHMNNPDIPFKWLQAADDPALAFVITDPLLFCPDYNPDIDEQDIRELHITCAEDRGLIVIVTIPHEEPEKMTANLQGPVMVNLKTREAKQIVLVKDEYTIRCPLLQNAPVAR